MSQANANNAVYLLAATRTPIGRLAGALATRSAPQLGATAIGAAIDRVECAGDARAAVDQVIMGHVLQAGVGQAPARQASIGAGMPKATGAITVNKVCGSGMRTVMDATNGIRSGEWQAVIAGGMESMSNAPHLLAQARAGQKLGHMQAVDAILNDGLTDAYGRKHMGDCAELCAAKFDFSRDAQDAFALTSYQRARAATEQGGFKAEMVAVEVPQRRGEPVQVEQDEEPFAANLDKLPKLKPVFAPAQDYPGTVTAANASSLDDGAAALVVAGANTVKRLDAKPLARIVAHATIAQEPEWYTTAPAAASQLALERAGLSVSDIDLWEINEAFAVVAMAAMQALELNPEQVNVNGGAVALGHPIGCSGARILTTLVHALVAKKARYGVATICIGGGEGGAIVVENLRR